MRPSSVEKKKRALAAGAAPLLVLLLFAWVAYRDVVFAGRTLTTAALVPGTAGMDGVLGHPDGRRGRPRVLDPGASGWQYEPWTYQIHDTLARGEFPLWNPHAAFGSPFAANGLSGVFTPLRWPILAAPSPVAFDVYLLGRLVLASVLAFLFFRRLALGVAAALAGAATFAYCGYFVLHVNMTHLDVEIVLPLLLVAADLVAREPGSRPVSCLALSTALATLGGNPESLAIALLVAAAFGAARARFRPAPLLRMAGGFALGLAVAAPLLLPEIEYVVRAAHVHDASVGLAHQPLKTLLLAFVPDFFGSIHNQWTAGNPQFRWIALGAAPWALAIAGLAARSRRGLVLVFGGIVLVSLLKVFGIEPVQSLGRLPVLDVIIFSKHLQPAIAIGVAGLAAIAIDRIARGDGGRRAALAGVVAVALVVAFGALRFRAEAAAAGESRAMIRAVLEQGALLATVAAGVLVFRDRRASAAALAAIVFLTLLLGVPGHRPRRHDPREVPAYVTAIRDDAGDAAFRVAGYDGVLHPNWAGLFSLDDLRSLDALNVATSLAWVKSRVEPLAADRFTGRESFSADLLSSAMDAANVRYLLSSSPLEDHATRLLARLAGAPLANVGERPAVRVAPGAPLDVTLVVPRFGARLDARVVTDGVPSVTGRPLASVAVVAGDGTTTEIAEAMDDRLRADLSDHAGTALTLRIVAEAAALVCEVDPALFGDRWESVPTEGPFGLFRNRHALPRAYVVRSALAAASFEEALAIAASAEFDARTAVVIEGPPASAAQRGAATPHVPAEIVARTSGSVAVSVEGLGPGYLVLLDAFDSGWVARVDGEEAPILRANGAFRAVAIDASARRVEFRYEPLSFRAGLAVGALGLAVALALLARRPRVGRSNA